MAEEMDTVKLRKLLVKDHNLMLEKAMNKHNPLHDKPYYILVVGNMIDNKIKSYAFVMDVRPPIDLLKSMLFKVDPISGKYEMVYCKPADEYTGHVILDTKRSSVRDLIAQNNVDSYTPIAH